jgi:hypothetical protein
MRHITAENADEFRRTWELIGLCLLCVQQAEHVLSGAVESVLDRREVGLMQQGDHEKKQTLGDFLMRLKGRTKLNDTLKERLFKFLEIRNTFVHEFSQKPEWDLRTAQGREAANGFLVELIVAALATTCLFMTLFTVSAKDDFGKDLFTDEEHEHRDAAAVLEKFFGKHAREILAGRYQKPAQTFSADD